MFKLIPMLTMINLLENTQVDSVCSAGDSR